jgi:hypothetical protein
MPIAAIREMGEADMLKTEGLMLQGVHMSHIRAGYKPELLVISICVV